MKYSLYFKAQSDGPRVFKVLFPHCSQACLNNLFTKQRIDGGKSLI